MSQIRFINTDLEVEVRRPPQALVAALEAHGVFALHEPALGPGGVLSIFFEAMVEGDAQTTVDAILDAVEALTGEAREIWDTSARRTLDLGFDAGASPHAFSEDLSAAIVARAAAAGLSLRITLYAP